MTADNERRHPRRRVASESKPARRDNSEGTDQPALFTEPDREQPWTDELHRAGSRRVHGQAEAVAAADRGWVADTERTIRQLAARAEPFTAEDVRAYVGDPLGPSGNAMGALFSVAAKAGLIRPVGFQPAARPEAHGRPIRVWIGRGRAGGT